MADPSSDSGTKGWPSASDQVAAGNPPVMSLPSAVGQVALNGSTMTGQEQPASFNAGPKAARRRGGGHRPFESARLAAGRTAAQFGPGHVPSHGFPITEGDEVHYVGPGTKGHPEREKGTVLEYLLMGPNPDDIDDDEHDGEFPYHDMALVYWGTEHDGYLDHAEVDDIVPNQHLNEYSRRLRRQSNLRTASGGGLDWTSIFGDDDGTRGHDATTEVGDLLQTHPEYPVGRHPTKPNVKVVHTDQPPVGWGYGIWFNQPVGPDSEFYDGGHGVDEDGNDRDGNLIHAGDNGHTVYPTHDEAKAAAEEHYYSFDHASRGRGYRDPSAAPDSGVDYSDLNKYMDEGGRGGPPGDDFNYGDIFGKESRMMARLAASGMSYEEAMAHIDEVLNAGEGHDLHHQPGVETGWRPHATPSGTPGEHRLSIERHLIDEDYLEEQLDSGTHLLDPEMSHEYHPSEQNALERMQDVSDDHGTEVVEYHDHANPEPGVRYFRFEGPEEDECQGYAELRPDADGQRPNRTASALFARLAAEGMSHDDIIRHIDEVLAQGEGHDLHHQPGVKGLEPEYRRPAEVRDHCRACGGDGRAEGTFDAGDSYEDCEECGGTGENQGDPYGECEGCGADTQIEDLTGDPDTGLYCPDCGGDACDYCGLNGGGHRHGCPER